MARKKSALLEPASEPTPPRVAEIAKVADRAERAERLTRLLREEATGAEVVAASRLLDSMERKDAEGIGIGLPPPTVRPEQVMRCVRLLNAFGPNIVMEALEIFATKYERARSVAMQNMKDGKLFDISQVRSYRKRIKLEEYPRGNREDQRSEHSTSGTATEESDGLPELREVEEPAGETSDAHESHGVGDGGTAE